MKHQYINSILVKQGLIESRHSPASFFLLQDKTYSKLNIIDELHTEAYVVKINNVEVFSSIEKPVFDENITLLDLMKKPKELVITDYIDPYVTFSIKELSYKWFQEVNTIDNKDIMDNINVKDNISLYSNIEKYNLKQVKTIDGLKLKKLDATNLSYILWHLSTTKISKEEIYDKVLFSFKFNCFSVKPTFLRIIRQDISWCFGGYDPAKKINKNMILKALSIPSLRDKLKIETIKKDKILYKYDKHPFIYYK